MTKNQRCCVSCRRIGPKSDFWRIVRQYPDNNVRLDQGMGRSVYLCPNLGCLKLAQKKDRLSRALKAKVDADLYQQLERRLSAVEAGAIEAKANLAATDTSAIN